MSAIARQKVEQAVGILKETGVDAWLTFVRETTETGDPVLPLILGQPVTWQSAFIVTASGERIAIVGRYEDEAVRSTGIWTDVISYVKGIREPLLEVLARLDPGQIAVNYSENDVKADGLTHGMHLLLKRHLEGTPYAERLVSAEQIISCLRGRKTRGEVDAMRGALVSTDEIFAAIAEYATPGLNEQAVHAFMHEQLDRRGITTAWESAMCPIVNTGSSSMVGHGLPSADLSITPGNVFHLDFGVCQDDYCSDIQRSWYVPVDGETAPPEAVLRGFKTVRGAIEAARKTLRVGARGWEVDAAARSHLVNAGYDEYQHATGHQVGRSAHDGGIVLGPRWERYGATPDFQAELDNVFTLELGIENLDGRGYLGLEEMVIVTKTGCEYLSDPQVTLPLLG